MLEQQKIIMDAFLAGKNNVADIIFVEQFLPDLIKRLKDTHKR